MTSTLEFYQDWLEECEDELKALYNKYWDECEDRLKDINKYNATNGIDPLNEEAIEELNKDVWEYCLFNEIFSYKEEEVLLKFKIQELKMNIELLKESEA